MDIISRLVVRPVDVQQLPLGFWLPIQVLFERATEMPTSLPSLQARASRRSSRGTITRRFAAVLLFGVALSVAAPARADSFTYSPIQAAARPFDLAIADRVGLAGSDARSANFQANVLPNMNRLIIANLAEKRSISNGANPGGLVALDPAKLTLNVASDVRVYFVGEGAGYHNSLGFNTGGGGVTSGSPLLLFPDSSSPVLYWSSSSSQTRTASEPLFPGDFVEMGRFGAGTKLDFFLIANGAKGGKDIYSTDDRENRDRIGHVVAFAQADNPYLLIGFEDMYGGGDNDFNDMLFAVDIGDQASASLIRSASLNGVPAPEPGWTWLVVLGCCGVLRKVRKRTRTEPA